MYKVTYLNIHGSVQEPRVVQYRDQVQEIKEQFEVIRVVKGDFQVTKTPYFHKNLIGWETEARV